MDTRGLCPTGWHVPTDGEWNQLVNYLDPNADTVCNYCTQSGIAGGALKSTSTQPTPGGWNPPNGGATNSSGFTAGPCGLRNVDGSFFQIGIDEVWWSLSFSGPDAWYRNLYYGDGSIDRNSSSRTFGFSVRCLKDIVPSVSTTTVSNVTATSANTGGNVTQDGGAPVTMRGVAYGTSSGPTTSGSITNDGTGTGVFTSALAGLTPSTTYYVRAYATNPVGTAYGNVISFSTNTSNGFSSCGGVTDVDGNSYQTVQIGTQCWTQSNLKVSKYRNGDSIPTGLNNSAWQNTTSGAFAIYDNNPVNDGLYGKLYNHYAVMDTRGLCPTGWHVPTDEEWNVMVKYLDPNADTFCIICWQSGIAGGALKSTATQPNPGGWNTPNTGATNSSGFSAGPGGQQDGVGFSDLGNLGCWWLSSPSGPIAWNRILYTNFSSSGTRDPHSRIAGFSVRCLRD
jgi:uncharacterized protein (TIGR02145 family)